MSIRACAVAVRQQFRVSEETSGYVVRTPVLASAVYPKRGSVATARARHWQPITSVRLNPAKIKESEATKSTSPTFH